MYNHRTKVKALRALERDRIKLGKFKNVFTEFKKVVEELEKVGRVEDEYISGGYPIPISLHDPQRRREALEAQRESLFEEMKLTIGVPGENFDFKRLIGFAGAPFPVKISERIFTPYAEELKEDRAELLKTVKSQWGRRLINFRIGGKFFFLWLSCLCSTCADKAKAGLNHWTSR